MDVKIGQQRFKEILYNYLDGVEELRYADEGRYGYDANIKEFFYTYSPDDESESEYEHSFTYYRSMDDYEEINGVTSPYDSSTYPLIEVNTYVYKKIIDLFGDTYAPQLILEWLNNMYGLDAVSIAEN